jgi:4-amino-4-deoxy-L-arabinose transferase-like glycosyltransferase
MFYENISGDDATVALMAKHILSGENLPVFFYRQSFMGSLNGFHMVPALFVFGPSVLLVRLNAVAWSLLFPLGLYVLARRVYDESAARVTLLLAAVPPFLLTYYSTVAEPHFETNTFGVVLLLLALGALDAPTEPGRVRVLACLGLVAGLACWTNMKTLVVLGPILLLLLARDPRLPLRRGGWLLAAGFVVGNLPAWLFYLTQPDPGQGNLGSARRFLESDIDLSWARMSEFLANAVPLVVGTYYWEPETPLRRLALGLCGAFYVAAVLLAGAEALRALRGRTPTRRAWGIWLLLLTLCATYAALYGSTFNLLRQMSRGRYLLPAYIPLLLFLGAAIARLARRSRLAAGAMLAIVLLFHLWTNLGYFWPLRPAERARRAAEMAARAALAQRLQTRPAEALLVDDPMESFRWQFLLSRSRISALTSEIYYPSAAPADAADRVAILATRRAARIPGELEAIGATATATSFGEEQLYENVMIPSRSYRLVPRAGWRALGEPDVAPASVADGDLGTAWPARRFDRSENGQLVLDLGAPQSIARLVVWPTATTDLIVPLEIAGSLDASAWQRLGVTPAQVAQPVFVVGQRPLFRPRNGWLELDVAPQRVRYLRIRPVEPGSVGVGMVGELFAYEAVDPPVEQGVNLEALLRLVHGRGVTRLLADPVVSARVALVTAGAVATLPANGVLNSHGFSPPMQLLARLRLRETDAALVPAEDAAELRERLERAGLPVTSEPVGSYVLFQPAAPLATSGRCRPTDWRVTAEAPEPDGRSARYIVEGRLAEPARLTAIRLEHPRVSTRLAAIIGVELSDDGRAWRAADGARPVPEWAWAGRTLFAFSGGATELAMGGAPARAVRVEVRLPYRGAGAITSLCVRVPG